MKRTSLLSLFSLRRLASIQLSIILKMNHGTLNKAECRQHRNESLYNGVGQYLQGVIYTEKKGSGPKIELCGIPKVIVLKSDF